jgi:hypothetical protein
MHVSRTVRRLIGIAVLSTAALSSLTTIGITLANDVALHLHCVDAGRCARTRFTTIRGGTTWRKMVAVDSHRVP